MILKRSICLCSFFFIFKRKNMGILDWFKRKEEAEPLEFGIALSGGSARGFAHIGVLKALEEEGIEPEIISGTSMGSLIGVLYAAGLKPDEIREIVIKEPILKLVRPAWGKHGFFKVSELRKILEKYIPADDFSVLKKPFCLAVSNINKGQKEIVSEGPLFEFVMASCAVPIIFAPQIINGTTYIDGGLYDNLPADAIRDLCKTLIGVHVNYIGEEDSFNGILDIAGRAFSLSIGENVRAAMAMCDYLIDPPELKNFSFWDYDKAAAIIDVGYSYTKQRLAQEKPSQALQRQ